MTKVSFVEVRAIKFLQKTCEGKECHPGYLCTGDDDLNFVAIARTTKKSTFLKHRVRVFDESPKENFLDFWHYLPLTSVTVTRCSVEVIPSELKKAAENAFDPAKLLSCCVYETDAMMNKRATYCAAVDTQENHTIFVDCEKSGGTFIPQWVTLETVPATRFSKKITTIKVPRDHIVSWIIDHL